MIKYSEAAPYGVSPLEIFGIPVHSAGSSQIHQYISQVVAAQQKALILNVNIHCVHLALENRWLWEFLKKAHLVFCDGDGVRWGE